MNNIVLAFSGGCFSGKTSAMNILKRRFGDDVVLISEVIREKLKNTPFSIDDVRQKPKAYLEFQFDVISAKIKDELDTLQNYENKLIIFDRALTDSLFYYTFYVDKSTLSNEDLKAYDNFLTMLIETTRFHCENIYDCVVEFKPINSFCDDSKYRPGSIDIIKNIENKMIHMYNCSFCKNVVYMDMNLFPIGCDEKEVINDLREKLLTKNIKI